MLCPIERASQQHCEHLNGPPNNIVSTWTGFPKKVLAPFAQYESNYLLEKYNDQINLL